MKCDAEGPAGQQFCPSCGANLQQLADEAIDGFRETIREARERADGHDYSWAITAVQQIAAKKHNRFRDLNEEAARLAGEFKQRRDEVMIESTGLFEAARRAADSEDYSEALKILDRIPEPLLKKDWLEFRTTLSRSSGQVATLERTIQDAINEKDTRRASLAVDQLLAVQPSNELAKRMALKLGQHLANRSVKLASEFRYEEALDALAQVPQSLRNEDVHKRIEHLRELVWMQNHLRQSPRATVTLLRIAERFAEVAPRNPNAKQILEQVRSRIKRSGGRPQRCESLAVGWATAPAETQLGMNVEFFPRPKKLQVSETPSTAAWKQNSRFYVAAGLALAGIDRAKVSANLLPKKKSGLLGGLSAFSRRDVSAAWGLDLGSSSIKAVRLEANDDQVEVTDVYLAEFDSKPGDNAPIVDALLAFQESSGIDAKVPLATNLPGMKVLSRHSTVPVMSAKKLDKVLEQEIGYQMPVPIDELNWAYHVTEDESGGEDFGQQLLLLAAKRAEVESRLTLFSDAELDVHVLQPDAVALHNLIQFENEDDDPVLIIDIGEDFSQFCLSWSKNLWIRTLTIGGAAYSNSLLKRLKLTHKQAELVKQEPNRAKWISPIYETWDTINGNLLTQVQQSLDASQREIGRQSIRKAYLVGGGSELHGLLRFLRHGRLLEMRTDDAA